MDGCGSIILTTALKYLPVTIPLKISSLSRVEPNSVVLPYCSFIVIAGAASGANASDHVRDVVSDSLHKTDELGNKSDHNDPVPITVKSAVIYARYCLLVVVSNMVDAYAPVKFVAAWLT